MVDRVLSDLWRRERQESEWDRTTARCCVCEDFVYDAEPGDDVLCNRCLQLLEVDADE